MPNNRPTSASVATEKSLRGEEGKSAKKYVLSPFDQQRLGILREMQRVRRGGVAQNTAGIEADVSIVDDSIADAEKNCIAQFEVSNLQRIDVLLSQISNAIERVLEGVGKICEDCGTIILQTRIKYVPEATRCIGCQTKYEASGKQSSEQVEEQKWNLEEGEAFSENAPKELTLDNTPEPL